MRPDPSKCVVLIAVIVGAAGLVVTGQDFVVQPPPMPIVSSPIAPVTQTFDQPLAGALSPRNASYDIDVRLDTDAHRLTGREMLRWRNISRQEAHELQFHLYWNAWRNADSTWMRERRLGGNRTPVRQDAWGSIDITSLKVRQRDGTWVDLTSRQRFIAPDDENPDDRTVMAVTLPAPVRPTEGTEVEIAWRSQIPRTFARTGFVGDYYFIGHWFPKIGVLEDSGWNTHQFHNRTEFYADFGVYDVRITVPRGWLVGSSGRQVDQQDNADGTSTHRFRGEDIHDVAWTTSPDFIEVRRAFEHASLPRVDMRLLLLREHERQAERHFTATAAALKYYGEWFGPYPYGYITIVDPAYQSGSSGMEYPTLFTAGTSWLAPALVADPEAVTIHEAGHQFWYGVVATNEFEHAWMDEGLNQFSDARSLEAARIPDHLSRRFFDGFVPWVFRDIPLARDSSGNGLAGYRLNAEANVPATPTFRYFPNGPSANAITYFKTALWLHTLERHLGWATVQKILSTYFDRWRFRHPKPEDFFRVANEVSGQDLTWFFDEVFRSSDQFDYGIQELLTEKSSDRYRTIVIAQRLGEATFPVDVVTTFRNGEQVTEHWDGKARRVQFVYDKPSEALSAEVDPRRVLLLDINRTNNSRTLQPRASEASLKWALTWMVWVQDLMLTYGFFA